MVTAQMAVSETQQLSVTGGAGEMTLLNCGLGDLIGEKFYSNCGF